MTPPLGSEDLGTLALAAAAAWLLLGAGVGWWYRHELRRVWREPTLRRPVLVVESDDWGAGPLAQAAALRAIADVLGAHRDAAGRRPVMSLALVLAVPDGVAIAASGAYRRIDLRDALFADVRAALREGEARGVYALQLHGLEHYRPATLMSCPDPAVQRWLRLPAPAATEALPAALQSRWVDAGVLPSRALGADEIAAAVAEEVEAYGRIVGRRPRVVVPPTFVWSRAVEAAWAAHGVQVVCTPGWRYPQRDSGGSPCGDEGPIVNGEQAGALRYLARVDYFEPVKGRGAAHALAVLARCVAEGRACILENHRDSFVGDDPRLPHGLAELDALCTGALQRHPGLRFLSSAQLAEVLATRDPAWVEHGRRRRLACAWRRLAASGRPWRLLRLGGWAALLGALLWLARVPLATAPAPAVPARG
jgi:hypothetical protein